MSETDSAVGFGGMGYGKRPTIPSTADTDSIPGDDDESKDFIKRKTRNLSEKKRRDQFNILINELCTMISNGSRRMDKSSVLKSTISYLKSHNDIVVQSRAHEINRNWKPSFLTNNEFTQVMLEAVDGFLLVMTQAGNILYASESVTSLLGHLPSDLVNRVVYDYILENERVDLHTLLSTHQVVPGRGDQHDYELEENQLAFTCHMRRGNEDGASTQNYELVKVIGNFRRWLGNSGNMYVEDDAEPSESVCFCCTVMLQRTHFYRELSFINENKSEFTSRHSLEWKFLFLDHRGPPIIGYMPFEVLGTSGYDYYHPRDLTEIAKSHEQLMKVGEGTSCYYRFLTKGQQWLWLQTKYYITYHQWNSKPEFVVCTHTVVSHKDVRESGKKDGINKPENQDGVAPDQRRSPVTSMCASRLQEYDNIRSISDMEEPHSSSDLLRGMLTAAKPVTMTAKQGSGPNQISLQNILKRKQGSIASMSSSSQTGKQSASGIKSTGQPDPAEDAKLTPAQMQLQSQLIQKHCRLQQMLHQQHRQLQVISSLLTLKNLSPQQNTSMTGSKDLPQLGHPSNMEDAFNGSTQVESRVPSSTPLLMGNQSMSQPSYTQMLTGANGSQNQQLGGVATGNGDTRTINNQNNNHVILQPHLNPQQIANSNLPLCLTDQSQLQLHLQLLQHQALLAQQQTPVTLTVSPAMLMPNFTQIGNQMLASSDPNLLMARQQNMSINMNQIGSLQNAMTSQEQNIMISSLHNSTASQNTVTSVQTPMMPQCSLTTTPNQLILSDMSPRQPVLNFENLSGSPDDQLSQQDQMTTALDLISQGDFAFPNSESN